MCKEEDAAKMCLHKPPFPMKPIEIGGTIILCFLMALAVMSGIGGGGIIVPLLMIFYNLDTKNAITVGGFTILTGAITRFAVTYKILIFDTNVQN